MRASPRLDDGAAADMGVTLLHGGCRDLLPTLPADSVQCVVTSPPYWGLRDYGCEGQLGLEPTPEAYLAQMVAVFRAVRRVLRADGTLWLNMGDSYANPGQDSRNAARLVRGLRERQFGVGNARGHRLEAAEASDRLGPKDFGLLKPKDLVGMPWRLAFALQADGWYLRADIIWAKPNPMPESVTDRPTKAHEYVFLLTKSARYFYDADAVREPHAEPWRGNGEHESSTPHAGRLDDPRKEQAAFTVARRQYNPAGRNLRSVWSIPSAPTPEAHFATFPSALASRCIQAGSRLGDTVLDPFAGSGTTGQVAQTLGRKALLIELSAPYVQLARTRTAQRGLFAEPAAR